jgi:putative tricarboxylic transport membrane protein
LTSLNHCRFVQKRRVNANKKGLLPWSANFQLIGQEVMTVGKVISIGVLIFAGYWAYKGWFDYGFWRDNGPGGGFLPVTMGLIVIVLTLYGLIKDNQPAEPVEKRNFAPLIGSVFMIAAIYIFGMLVSAGLFIIAWLIFVEKYPRKKSIIIGCSTTVIIWFLFRFILNVPFPQGFIGI